MDQELIDLYHRHVGTGFDRQLRLADFLAKKSGGESWAYDVPTATLTFGQKVAFEAPLVGSHADHNNSWLWAWSNRNLRLTLTNRAMGDTVRALGHRHGIDAFSMVGMPLEPLLGPELAEHAAHVLGVVLSRELGFDAYYTAPYEGGRALVLVRDDRLKFAERHPLVRVVTVFPQVISALPVYDHKAALRHYADDYGLTAADEAGGLRLTAGGKDHLTATFDDRGRLTSLEGTVSPAPAAKPMAAKKPAAKKAAKKPAKAARPAAKPKAPAKKVAKKPAPVAKPKKPAAATKKPTPKPVKGPAKMPAKPAPKGKAGKKR